jgi:hypothetical protein
MAHQARALQRCEMAGDGGLAHREGLGEVARAGLARPQAVQDGAARGIGERAEQWVEIHFHNESFI